MSIQSIQIIITNLYLSGDIDPKTLVELEEQIFGFRIIDKNLKNQNFENFRNQEIPFRSMLARSISSQKEVEKWITKISQNAIIEHKYDGERIQVFFEKNSKKIKMFSRSFEDSNKKFKPILPNLVAQLDSISGLETCIIDGEMVPYNYEDKKVLSFSHIQKMNKISEENLENNLKIFAFDILEFNGEYLLDRPLDDRKAILESLLHLNSTSKIGDSKVIEAIESTPITFSLSQDGNEHDENESSSLKALETIEKEWKFSQEKKYEGLMIKPIGPNSTYIPGSRTQWLKLKKVEGEHYAEDTLDLVVLGLYEGKGKRKGVFGSFLLGVYEEKTDSYWPVTK